MVKMLRRKFALFVFCLCLSASAHASFHLWQIAELFSNADGTIQFIRLSTSFGGQQFIAGHTIKSSGGGVDNSYTFATDLPGDTTNHSFLIATQGFAALNLVTPDYVVPNGFLTIGNGSLNFADVDTVSYASLPTDGTLSLKRNGTTQINSPQNFSGASGSIDGLPDPFSFMPVSNAARDTVQTSNAVTLSGFVGPLPISVSGGSYSIDGQPYSSAPGTVSSGKVVTLRQTSSSQRGARTRAVLMVGPSSANFDVTTGGAVTPWLTLLLD